MTSCQLTHETLHRACAILYGLIEDTLDAEEAGDGGEAPGGGGAVLRDGLEAMQSHMFAHLIDVHHAHRQDIESATRFISAGADSGKDADLDQTLEAADNIALRYGIEPNRARLPTPEPAAASRLSQHRLSSSMSSYSEDSPDEAVLAKLRNVDNPSPLEPRSDSASRLHGASVKAAGQVTMARAPLGSLASSSSSFDPPPFMPRPAPVDGNGSPAPVRSALSIATARQVPRPDGQLDALTARLSQTSLPPMLAPSNGLRGDDGSNGRQAAAPAPRSMQTVLGPGLDASSGSRSSAHSQTRTGLADSLVFMRRKASLTEMEQAVSGRRRRAVVMTAPRFAGGLGLEVDGSAHHGLFVTGVNVRSPAESAGLRECDQILAANGISLIGKTTAFFAQLVQGRSSDDVILTVQYNRSGMEEYHRDVTRGY